MQRSDSSKHPPAVAKLALHLPPGSSRIARQSQGFKRQGTACDFTSQTSNQGTICDFGVTTSNDFLTRSNDNQQRVSHSFRRASRSFQICNPTSFTLVSTSFALVPDSQPTVAITRGQATNVLQLSTTTRSRGKRIQQRSATMFAVNLLCVLRAHFRCLTPVMGCAHMDDHRACRVTSVHTLSTTTKRTENNKCSAVAYVDGQAQTPPDEGANLHLGVSALCQLSALSHSRKCRINTFETVRTHPSRSTSAVAKPGSSPGLT